MKYMEFLKAKYSENGELSLTVDEIKSYEYQLGVYFPKALYEFYQLVGKSYVTLFGIDDGSLASTVYLTSELAKEKQEGYFCNLELDKVFILGAYSDDILFIYKEDMTLEDPPVYIYALTGRKQTNYVDHSAYLFGTSLSSRVRINFDELISRGMYKWR